MRFPNLNSPNRVASSGYACYGMSDGSDQPFRLRIHDPSFFNLAAMNLMLPGNLIADMMAIFASLDTVMGGVDK